MRRPTAIVGLAVLLSGITPGQNMSTSQPDQQSFGIGHRNPVVKHPVSISDTELQAIQQVTVVDQSMAGLIVDKYNRSPSMPKPTREGLEAAVVHLNGLTERDLVVIGSGRRYARGKFGSPWAVAPLWVIREERGRPKVVLAVFTRELQIMATKHRGLADLVAYQDTGMGGMNTTFEFNGSKYVEGLSITN